MSIKIDILTLDGSPLGVTLKSLWGTDGKRVGVGGSEYALLTMCEYWHNVGHKVTLYNTPFIPDGSPFEQRPTSTFNTTDPRDVLITFRSPNPKSIVSTGYKVWWSCDQFTQGSFQAFAPHMQKIVCISDFHKKYFSDNYGINNVNVLDLPVRVQDFAGKNFERIQNRFIFTSVPARGLQFLRPIWNIIKREIPDASLIITSDYRLWGVGGAGNEQFRVQWIGAPDVEFLGAISRERLIEEQLQARYFIYPSNYDELFCISCAEAQVAGAYPFTTETGALGEINMGHHISATPGTPNFEKLFSDIVLENMFSVVPEVTQMKAIDRFNINKIGMRWDEEVFKGI